ncbi:MAG: hypothetical protein NZM44_06095, partial [Candidatus Calescibacterium sp.]|nr:hypothetical protein [Candidatus Calescibacterium sp.]
KNINDDFYYAYKKRLIEEKGDDLKLFIQSFYDSRRYIKDMNEEFWILLNQPFEKEVRIFIEVYKRYNVGILSTKQKYAIISILHYYGIPIDPNVVFAKENDFIHKGKKIKEIINLWGIVERDLHFVDDLIENLLKIRNYAKGVNLYMSSWGYNNFAHRSLAKKNGIKIIDSIDYLIRKGE